MTETAVVLVEKRGQLGHIKLNRPKALNSINYAMVTLLRQALDDLATDDNVLAVLISGEGGRAFCAGGDIRELYEVGRGDPLGASKFWQVEYPLNNFISNYPKPYIALMDGIVMGGGVGLSAHGSYRVVTDKTRLAMPEVAIGFFPDVGATWLLANAPGETGTWVGLTGESISGADAIYLGLADYFVPHDNLADLTYRLEMVSSVNDLKEILEDTAVPPPASKLAANRALIDSAFAANDVKGIFRALAVSHDAFATSTLETLQTRSPTSLKLTLRLLREARNSFDLKECLEREYHAGVQSLHNDEFYEGVRSVVIDKDRNAKWDPPTIDTVDEAVVDTYFPGKTGALVF